MKYNVLLLISAVAIATACTQQKPASQPGETAQCLNWRTMMTAPMPPDARTRLRTACEASRSDEHTSRTSTDAP